jgi:hypothetical protein
MTLALSHRARPTTTATPTVPTIIATETTRHTTTMARAPSPTLPRMVTSTRSKEAIKSGKESAAGVW